MKKLIPGALLASLISVTMHAQDTIPHVQGKVIVSVTKGTIECDLTLSNMPRLSDYYLRLNSGMNIRYIKNAEGPGAPLRYERSMDDSLSSGESLAYYIPGYGKSGKYLPHAIHFNYVGMYPVITDTSSAEDWRGNIAFNGTTLRADGIQSAWVPILYDVKTDTRYEKVTYDLDITCNDCGVIYVNGSQPVPGTHAAVKSNTSQDLTMFAGNFKSVAINGSYFLNPDADEQQLTQLEKVLHSYQAYLEKKLSIPYKGNAVYIQTTPVSKNNSWLFASYPTIVKVGWEDGMKTLGKTEGNGLLQYMAHELAHYYFGTYRSFNAELGDMISEGFAELLALDITRNWISDSLYREKLQSKARAMRNFKPMPIAAVHSKNDYRNRELFVYYYAPLVFSAIEKEIGEDKTWAWMKALLQSPTMGTNFAFVEQTLSKAVNDKNKFAVLREKYFTSDNALQNALSVLNIKADESSSAASGQKPAAKTYYYFLFSRPMIDAGSPQNNVIKHTEIAQVTCTWDELMKLGDPLFKRIANECENEGGCTSDLNTYDSMEAAQKALKRWLDRNNKTGKMEVKILKP